MILSPEELRRLVELKHTSPHAVLGRHRLTNDSGLVVRAFLPQAGKVEVHPREEAGPPPFELQRIHLKAGVIEGITAAASKVYPYQLVVTTGPYHPGVQKFVADLNQLYLAEPGLWQADFERSGTS